MTEPTRDFPPAPLPRGMHRMAAKECYRNAALTAAGQTAAPALAYAEGWALPDRPGAAWVPHAWNVDAHGNAIDRTWPVPGARYVGVIVPTPEVLAMIARDGETHPLRCGDVPAPAAVPRSPRKSPQLPGITP